MPFTVIYLLKAHKYINRIDFTAKPNDFERRYIDLHITVKPVI